MFNYGIIVDVIMAICKMIGKSGVADPNERIGRIIKLLIYLVKGPNLEIGY